MNREGITSKSREKIILKAFARSISRSSKQSFVVMAKKFGSVVKPVVETIQNWPKDFQSYIPKDPIPGYFMG